LTDKTSQTVTVATVFVAVIATVTACVGWNTPQRPLTPTAGGQATGAYADQSPTIDGRQQKVYVPRPLDELLPTRITIHPFTGVRTVDSDGKPLGFEVRIKALDNDDDPTKAFGDFMFMLYDYRPQSENPRGARLGVWPENLMDPDKNQLHWDPISQSYKFNLGHKQPLSMGHRYVLDVFFTSPFTERLTATRVFVADK